MLSVSAAWLPTKSADDCFIRSNLLPHASTRIVVLLRYTNFRFGRKHPIQYVREPSGQTSSQRQASQLKEEEEREKGEAIRGYR